MDIYLKRAVIDRKKGKTHPPGAVAGFPKDEAARLIDKGAGLPASEARPAEALPDTAPPEK